ncbi:Type-1 restriction enzyme R protein, partial [Mycoplasmopsis synoviae]
MFKESFQFSDKNVYRSFQSDVALRLAHKESYTKLNKDETKENQIDILIVVDQFLTGYDSKYVNTLYLDKVMNDKTLVQAFSRTNRIW